MSAATSENPWAGRGSVLLDIGDDVGALIVTTPASMIDQEIDIDRADGQPLAHGQDHGQDHGHDHGHAHGHGHGHDHGHHHRPHVAVVARPTASGVVPSLVFPELQEGRYHLFHKGQDDVLLTVEVRGGEVTTATWPTG